jgi:general secretion pathway protein F
VPLVEALRIAREALSNKALQVEVEPLVSAVKSGKRLSVGFASVTSAGTGVVPLIKVAEETGELDPVLLGLAERFEVEGQRTMTRVLAAMEPLIIIVLGMMVAFIIVSILSGVLSINNTI